MNGFWPNWLTALAEVPTPGGASTASTMVAIVLVNWNGWRDTIDCIRSCLALDYPDWRIIVCDNASRDGSCERILDWARGRLDVPVAPDCPLAIDPQARPASAAMLDRAAAEAGDDGGGAQLLVVPTGGNLGFAGGNNVGIRWALARGAGRVWLLNNDTVVRPDTLRALIAGEGSSGLPAGLTGSLLADYEEPGRVQALCGAISRRSFRGRHVGVGEPLPLPSPPDAVLARHWPGPGELVYPVGASMLASAAFLRQVGLMDEGYFLYYEEADWVLRNAGRFAITIAPASVVYHRMGASAGSTDKRASVGAMSWLFRSRLRACWRFARWQMPYVLLGLADEVARDLLRGRTARIRAVWRLLCGRVRPGS